jgi:nucleotide-binding universal stress UspA family protein
MKTVLAPIDFSPRSDVVIEEALALARALAARVILVHAVHLPPFLPEVTPAFRDSVAFSSAMTAARDELTRLQKRLAQRGATVETTCLPGAPVAVVLALAEQQGADYIVLGSHGHTALYNLVLGGTASAILQQAACRVVIVPRERQGHGVRRAGPAARARTRSRRQRAARVHGS